MAKDKEILYSDGEELNLLHRLVGGPPRLREPSLRMDPLKMKPSRQALYCKFCARKFSSLQALGGHQNAHKRERAAQKLKKVGPVVDILPQIQPGGLGPFFPKLPQNESSNINGLLQVQGHWASDPTVYRSSPPLLPLPQSPCRPREPVGLSSYQRQWRPPPPTRAVLHNPQAMWAQPPCWPGGEPLGLNSYQRQWWPPPPPTQAVLCNPQAMQAQPPCQPGGEPLGMSSHQRQWWPAPPTRAVLHNPQSVRARPPCWPEGEPLGLSSNQRQWWPPPPPTQAVLHNHPQAMQAQPPCQPGGEPLGMNSHQRQWWPPPRPRAVLHNPQSVQRRFLMQREDNWTGFNGLQHQLGITSGHFRSPDRTTEAPKDDGEIDLSLKL